MHAKAARGAALEQDRSWTINAGCGRENRARKGPCQNSRRETHHRWSKWVMCRFVIWLFASPIINRKFNSETSPVVPEPKIARGVLPADLETPGASTTARRAQANMPSIEASRPAINSATGSENKSAGTLGKCSQPRWERRLIPGRERSIRSAARQSQIFLLLSYREGQCNGATGTSTPFYCLHRSTCARS